MANWQNKYPGALHFLVSLLAFILFLSSCSVQRKINNIAHADLLADSILSAAHVGISIYEPAVEKYLYNYQGEKYFVPASNTKIFTCYAAMKYLKHILPGIRYFENDTAVFLIPTGDPTLLHPDYKMQPVLDFLKGIKKTIYISDANWRDQALGSGWSWDDYNDYYMVERSALPVYGNIIRWIQERSDTVSISSAGFDQSVSIYSSPEVNWKVRFNSDASTKNFFVRRERNENIFEVTQGKERHKDQDVPFVSKGIASALELLADTIGKAIVLNSNFQIPNNRIQTIWSQPTDSMLVPMMLRSDNFFAEQALLMVSNETLGIMNDEKIIHSLLAVDLSDLPQKPVWTDGSGLSRYNLFTPQCFIFILKKMRMEFGMDRLKTIFPTGRTGTLSNYYKQDSGFIYAKTGTLSGVVTLSGFLYTKKNRLLIFSVLVNNHRGSGTMVRRKVEDFIIAIRNKY